MHLRNCKWGWSEVSCTHNKTLILHLFVLSPRGKGTSLTHCVSICFFWGTPSSRYPSLPYLYHHPQDNCKVNVYSPYQHCSSLVRFIATPQHRTRTRNSICFLLIVGFCKQQWVCVQHGDDEEEEDVSLEQECSIVTGTGFIRKEEELRHDPSCWLNVVQKIVYKFAVVILGVDDEDGVTNNTAMKNYCENVHKRRVARISSCTTISAACLQKSFAL